MAVTVMGARGQEERRGRGVRKLTASVTAHLLCVHAHYIQNFIFPCNSQKQPREIRIVVFNRSKGRNKLNLG